MFDAQGERERTAGTGLSRRGPERAPSGSDRSRSPEVSSCRMSPSRRPRPRRYACSPPLLRIRPPALPQQHTFFSLTSSVVAASMRLPCVGPWSTPSAAPMPPVPGTGRPPTTPARRRPCCSCASSDRPFGHGLARQLPSCPCSAGSRRFFLPIRAAPRRARRCSNSRRRSRSRSSPPALLRSPRPISCSSPRLARVCSPSSPSSRAAGWP